MESLGREYAGNSCVKSARDTVASEILSMLECTATRAEKTVSIVMEKTNSVTRQEPPSVQEVNKLNTPQQQYPPLFARIQELTESINRSLSGIEDIMRRCEL
jgi:hypothetical protein